jgi:hypothetical protein
MFINVCEAIPLSFFKVGNLNKAADLIQNFCTYLKKYMRYSQEKRNRSLS